MQRLSNSFIISMTAASTVDNVSAILGHYAHCTYFLGRWSLVLYRSGCTFVTKVVMAKVILVRGCKQLLALGKKTMLWGKRKGFSLFFLYLSIGLYGQKKYRILSKGDFGMESEYNFNAAGT